VRTPRRAPILLLSLWAGACASRVAVREPAAPVATAAVPVATAAAPVATAAVPRNVILLIGDGMGAGQLEAAHVASGAGYPEDRLAMERLPVVGLMRTTAAGGAITDSAAGATAMATGVKTLDGRAGVGPDGAPLRSIAETLAESGVAIGFVSSGPITNATPAGFLTHVASREEHSAISHQLATGRADVLVGGSKRFDAEDEAARRGFTVLSGDEAFLKTTDRRVLALVDGLAGAPPPAGRKASRATLADLTGKAVSLLGSRGPCGFFLVVEEDGIDDWAHENDLSRMLIQLRRFDEAVAASVAFARADGETLVIVTADHETGGLLMVEGARSSVPSTFCWSTREHSGGSVALFAYGPRAGDFGGVLDNTDLPKRLARLFEERRSRKGECRPR